MTCATHRSYAPHRVISVRTKVLIILCEIIRAAQRSLNDLRDGPRGARARSRAGRAGRGVRAGHSGVVRALTSEERTACVVQTPTRVTLSSQTVAISSVCVCVCVRARARVRACVRVWCVYAV